MLGQPNEKKTNLDDFAGLTPDARYSVIPLLIQYLKSLTKITS